MGTGCTPVVLVNSSTPTLASPALFQGAEVGGVLGKKDRDCGARGAEETQCSIQCLAGTQVHDGASYEILS